MENDYKIKAAAMMDKPLNGNGGGERGIRLKEINPSQRKVSSTWFVEWIYLVYF